MNFSVAFALLLLVGLLTLVSYVDRVYQEIGKFLSREFQDNIDIFEQKIEPKLGVSRTRAALSMAILTQLTMAAIYLDRKISFARVPGQHRHFRAEDRTQTGREPHACRAFHGNSHAVDHGGDLSVDRLCGVRRRTMEHLRDSAGRD